jgi:hypothetical protein
MSATTDYQKQAADFLEKFGIKFVAKLSDTKTPPWPVTNREVHKKNHGHHFRVMISKGKRGQGVKFGQRVAFDFWASLADMDKGIKTVTPYDVLACISGDVNCPETFADFCAEYGYDEDSRSAEKIFKNAATFGRRLRAFFTPEEIEALQKIQ